MSLFIQTYAYTRNGITQRPRDHLFRNWGQLCETKASAGKSKNSPKLVCAWLVHPNTLPLGQYESIYSYYMHIVVLLSHRSPMTMYFKWSVQLVLRLEEAKNRPNVSFCLTNLPKTSTTWKKWVGLFILYVYRRMGITQKPHDDLFPKSCLIGATCASAGKSARK